MPIDTENKRRSVSGYTITPVLPIADSTVGALDREMVAWLYAGIPPGGGIPPVPTVVTVSADTIYDMATAGGPLGGTILAEATIYDHADATGAAGGVMQPSETTYD